MMKGLDMESKTLEGMWSRLSANLTNGMATIGGALAGLFTNEQVMGGLTVMGNTIKDLFKEGSAGAQLFNVGLLVLASTLIGIVFTLGTILNVLASVGDLWTMLQEKASYGFDFSEEAAKGRKMAQDKYDAQVIKRGDNQTVLNNMLTKTNFDPSMSGYGVNLYKEPETKPVLSSIKADKAKQVVGIQPNTTVGTAINTANQAAAVDNTKAATTQVTAAQQNAQTALTFQQVAQSLQASAQQFVLGADRIASAPTPSVSYSFMPQALGNQGR
jgi:hypothetical protein